MLGTIKMTASDIEAIVGTFQITTEGALFARPEKLYLNYIKKQAGSLVFEFRSAAGKVLVQTPEMERIISKCLDEFARIEGAHIANFKEGKSGYVVGGYVVEFQFLLDFFG
ncbi:MAG: hypothetical protein GY853_05645 [PVC group bacterium]|nr:hypothetical protein [PVC group bacterium]